MDVGCCDVGIPNPGKTASRKLASISVCYAQFKVQYVYSTVPVRTLDLIVSISSKRLL
jgi:hypothetical protein